ncbi:MAG: nucleotidyltransferase family protein [Microcystaceae cyanobacterium]
MFDYANAKHYLQKKQENLKNKRLTLWKQAERDVNLIIVMVIQEYSPQRIIQWGSVLDSKHFSEASDIDLAVEGVDAIRFMDLLARAEEMTCFSLDLLRWENIDPSFQKTLLRKGKIVYG